METRTIIPEQQLDFQHIKAVLKKFAERNDFIIKGKIVLQPQVLQFKSNVFNFAPKTDYPVCLVEAYRKSYNSKNKNRYFLAYNISSAIPDEVVPFCETSSPQIKEIKDFFVWEEVKYQKNNDGFVKI